MTIASCRPENLSFRHLGGPEGNPALGKYEFITSLIAWAIQIYDVPLSLFTAEDLSRACRQNMYPELVVPWAIAMLKKEISVGMLFEGELVYSLFYVPLDYWRSAPECRAEIIRLISQSYDEISSALDSEIDEARLTQFLEKLKGME